MIASLKEIPLSLYIHIPWCERKCPYCDFNSHDNLNHFDEAAYIDALLDDLAQDMPKVEGRSLSSIFIGGGTPSLFSGKAYTDLFNKISDYFDLTDVEITLEANPSSSEREKFSVYRESGINRLSIGVQSFHADMLKKIGRVHNSQDALNAAQAARVAGFDNFNLDIMFALPEQTAEQSLTDVLTAIEQKPTHLSCYQLTLEPNTLFYKSPPKLPTTELAWDMQAALQMELANNGYQQYEVSAYAKDAKQCLHNRNYWEFGDYLGIGAGAHGKLSYENGKIERYWKQKQPKQFLQTANNEKRIGAANQIAQADRSFEFLLNALRLKSGFSKNLFEQRTGQDFTVIEAKINKQIEQGLLENRSENKDNRIIPTERGFRFIDSLLNDYL